MMGTHLYCIYKILEPIAKVQMAQATPYWMISNNKIQKDFIIYTQISEDTITP
jgi:hypothetical protein